MREVIPLRERKLDIAFLVFFAINLFYITYIVDLEQLVIADPSNFEYPIWPPKWGVDANHWWGGNFDPLQLARPAWWRATIWIDSLFFGPFYAVAIYAYVKGKDWMRIPSIVYGATLMTVVTIIMFEEYVGQHRTPEPLIVSIANAPWFFMPALVIWRMWRAGEHPFTRPAGGAGSGYA
ncbi:MAG: DUF2781 domain-containing protein [Candidatus Methylomirabilis sp.]|nr:DUF2781 domain-containing protein [Deltaproteobacteria bacterium]